MKLNFGCGTDPKPDYWNFDLHPPADGSHDGLAIYKLDLNIPLRLQLPEGCVPADEVLLSHVLEHIVGDNTLAVLRSILDILAIGGLLVVETPDVTQVFNAWVKATYEERWCYIEQEGNCYPALTNYIWGQGQEGRGQLHFTGFDRERLQYCLERVGFVDIRDAKPRLGYSVRLTARKQV